MRLIIAGSRSIALRGMALYHLSNFFPNPDEIVSGGAKGVDTYADYYAKTIGKPFKLFKADWDTHGKAAGPIRNKQMAEYSDALLLIWDGKSKGSASMKKEMLKLKKPVYEVILRQHNV